MFPMVKAVQKRLREQVKDVEAVQSQEVHLFWHGVAEVINKYAYLLKLVHHSYKNYSAFYVPTFLLIFFNDQENGILEKKVLVFELL